MKGAPRSSQFDDIYFSAKDGVAETKHVFLQANGLPHAWERQDSFVVAETGFGTGLNFLSVWKLFEETANAGQSLDFISIEKYPLSMKSVKEALEPWADYFGGRLDIFCKKYPLRVAGFHRIKINSQITLTLIFDDIAEAMPQIDAQVDCWFLDGFTPAKNPDMWGVNLFENMARLSHSATTYSTFTAAGDVRRGLENVGFSVHKKKGFGYKRDMIAGGFLNGPTKPQYQKPKRVAIIGGGLAGTSCAYALKQYGFDPVIYEANDHLASGASGNELGLYNPRFSKLRDDLSEFFTPAYAQMIYTAREAGEEVEYTPCGALHLMDDTTKAERYKSMAENWLWHTDHVRVVNAKQASEIAGIEIDFDALYLPDSGSISPQKLCEFYAKGCEVHLNCNVETLSEIKADAIILASAAAVQNFEELSWLNIESVRGQISKIKATESTKNLKCHLLYGGYLSSARDGTHVTGSTFEKWIKHTDVTEANHQENFRNLKENIPSLQGADFVALDGRAGMRAATNDRFPVIGAVPNTENVYVSAAFGSHGIISSIAGAHYIADILRNGPKSLSQNTINALKPQRFLDRAKKRGLI